MPADSEGADLVAGLPQTFRPLGVRVAGTVLGGLLLLTTVFIWLAMPPDVRSTFSWLQRATIGGIVLVALACVYALSRSRVVARSEGILVVNGYRARALEWNQVLSIRLPQGAPWAKLNLSDGTSASAMGIQGSDGARARDQVRSLRALVEHFSRTDSDD